MTKTKIPNVLYIHNVCSPCGITANYLTCLKRYGRPPKKKAYEISTFHKADCDMCGESTHVTEVRDFFHPDFSLITNLMQKYVNKKLRKTNRKTGETKSKRAR